MIINCKNCGKEVTFSPSHKRKFCSTYCSNYNGGSEIVKKICNYCSNEFEVTKTEERFLPAKFCSRECHWKSLGYPSLKTYQNVKINGKTLQKHRVIMEQHLGRKLKPTEIVHHINHDKKDNRLENLMVINRKKHFNYHHIWTEDKRKEMGERMKNFWKQNPELKKALSERMKKLRATRFWSSH